MGLGYSRSVGSGRPLVCGKHEGLSFCRALVGEGQETQSKENNAFSLDQFDELLAMLTSPYLKPPMALQSRHYNVEDNWGRITLSCAGTEQAIEIRTTLR